MHNYIVETDRLILRPLTAADAPAVFAWGSDPEVNRYMSYPLERSVADAEAWLHVVEKSGPKDGYDFGFVRREDGLLIGSGGVYPWSDGRTWTFGYNLRHAGLCWRNAGGQSICGGARRGQPCLRSGDGQVRPGL